jgi:hypothetical protein
MRLIVAGSRGITDGAWVMAELDRLTHNAQNISAVISGGARGVDRIGESWAIGHDIPVEVYPAEWDRDGRGAGYRRNERMASKADALAAFWDGESRGTKHMIEVARNKGLLVRVIRRG